MRRNLARNSPFNASFSVSVSCISTGMCWDTSGNRKSAGDNWVGGASVCHRRTIVVIEGARATSCEAGLMGV